MSDPADDLFRAVAGLEPEEMRSSYLATPDPKRLLGFGSTAPLIGTPMVQNEAGLMVPHKSPGAQMADMSLRYMTCETLFGMRLGVVGRTSLLARHSLESVLSACARLLAQLYDTDPTNREVHRSLIQALPPEPRQLAQKLLLDNWMYLAPQHIVAVIKLALLGPHVPQSDPDEALGAVVVAALDFGDDCGADVSTSSGGVWKGTDVPETLAIETFQNQLFNRSVDLGTELARWHRTREVARAYDPGAAQLYDEVFLDATGCGPDVLFDVGFGALLQFRTTQVVHIDPAMFGQLAHPADQVAAAVDLLATDIPTLTRLVAADVEAHDIEWTANSLRRYPMLRCGGGALLVLHPQFLIERMCGTAFFWEVRNELGARKRSGTNAKRKAAKKLDGGFMDFTGHVAEEYTAERLIGPRGAGPSLSKQSWREDELRRLWPQGKCCDVLIEGTNSWVVLDVINHAVSARAAEAGLLSALEDDIVIIVDEKAEKLDETIMRLIENGGALPAQPKRGFAPRYHPVVVAARGFPWNTLMEAAIRVRLAERGLLQHALIQPFTVITTDEAEFIESAVERGHGNLPEMLDRRVQTGKVGEPFDWYLSRHGGLIRPESLRSPMRKAFAQLAGAIGLDPELLSD